MFDFVHGNALKRTADFRIIKQNPEKRQEFSGHPGNGKIPENTDKKGTFDYIYVDINIVTNWEKDRMTYIKENQKKIKQLVFDRIEDAKAFEKYGITTEDLKVKKVTLNNKTSMLYYVLEKKNA